MASVIAALSVSGCVTAVAVGNSEPLEVRQQRFAAAEEKTRAERPLVNWVLVKPEQLVEVTPERLKEEASALVVIHADRALANGEKSGVPGVVNLRELLSGTTREVVILPVGEGQVGWGVAILPPGKYVLNGSAVLRRTVLYANGQVGRQALEMGGHAYVPLDKAITVDGGDVLYVGSVTGVAASYRGRVDQIRVKDDRAAAARWMEANLPKLAPKMKTRLLTPLEHTN